MNTFSVTDLRHRTAAVLAEAQKKGYVSLVRNSKQDAYVVDAEYFHALQEAYQEYLDIIEFDAGQKSLHDNDPIPFDQL